MKRTLIVVALVFMTTLLLVGTASAGLITNGDFNAGNSGFDSDYLYFEKPGTPASSYGIPDKASLYDEGTYGVGTNPADYHVSWASFGDHTTGSGNMLIVNGAPVAGVKVWGTDVTVVANTTYYFSAYMTSVYPPPVGSNPSAPAQLVFSIAGNEIGSVDLQNGKVGIWQQYWTAWTAPISGTVSIALKNSVLTAGGNDFAIDDIQMDTNNPVPEAGSTLLLLSFGIGAVSLMAKRWMK